MSTLIFLGENNEAEQALVRSVSAWLSWDCEKFRLRLFEKICLSFTISDNEFSGPWGFCNVNRPRKNNEGAVLTGAIDVENLCVWHPGYQICGSTVYGDGDGANFMRNPSGAPQGDSNLMNRLFNIVLCGATWIALNLTGANLQYTSPLGCSMVECSCPATWITLDIYTTLTLCWYERAMVTECHQ